MADQGSAPVTCTWEIPPDAEGSRLDSFVRRCLPHLSEREARRAIDAGAFWVDRRPGKKGERLFAGSEISLRGFPHLLAPVPPPASGPGVSILYEDQWLLALDKPAGMATRGFSGRAADTLANIVAAIRPSLVGVGADRWEAGLGHRLDRDTSGVVLAAKDQTTFDRLREAFRRGAVRKIYRTLVRGTTPRKGVIDTPLEHDRSDRRKMKPAAGTARRGKPSRSWPARTRFERLSKAPGFSLLEVEIVTGVTHQIRVHLASIGHPVVGDSLYDPDRRGPFGIGRLFLHALALRLEHPHSGRALTVESPLPAELRRILEQFSMRG